MTIAHLKLWLRQDADMPKVKEIVSAYDGAFLDDDNYIVYYNTQPNRVIELSDKLRAFRYDSKIVNETF